MVAYPANNARIELEFRDECEAFKQDAIRSKVASVSCAYDPVLFCDTLDDNIALSKFLQLLEAQQLVQDILTVL